MFHPVYSFTLAGAYAVALSLQWTYMDELWDYDA